MHVDLAARSDDTRSHGAAPRYLLRGLAGGLVAAGCVVGVRLSGTARGWPIVIATGILLLAVPLSREFSRRVVALGGLSGWIPLLWWFRPPVTGTTRVTILLALLAGGLAWYVAAHRDPRTRLRSLVPRFRLVDLAVPLSAAAAGWMIWPWFTAAEPDRALATMTRGWDNSAHFAMADLISREGAVARALPSAPDGGPWSFVEYPQHFHTYAALLIDLLHGGRPLDRVDALPLYTHAVAILFVLGTVLVVSAAMSSPLARRRPLLAVPVCAGLVSVFAVGPGMRTVELGHQNFLLGTQTTIAAVALLLQVPRRRQTLLFSALGGAVVAAASEWTPLLVMAGTCLLMAMTRLGPPQRPWRKARSVIIIGTLAAAASVAGIPSLLRLDLGEVVLLSGDVQTEGIRVQLAVIVLAVVLPWFAGSQRTPRARRLAGTWPNVAWVPVAGITVFALVLGYQLASAGHASYYSIKMLLGTSYVATGVLGIALMRVTMAWRLPRRRGAAPVVAATCGVAAALMPLVGHDRPEISRIRNQAVSCPRLLVAERLLAAARFAPTSSGTPVYVGITGPDLPFVNGDQWYTALTGDWTVRRSQIDGLSDPVFTDLRTAARGMRGIWQERPDVIFVVDPSRQPALRELLDGAVPAARVVSWPETEGGSAAPCDRSSP